MFDYSEAQGTVKELLLEYGMLATLQHNGSDIPNVSIAVLNYNLSLINGSTIMAGDRMVYMEAGNIPEPIPGEDLLFIDNVAHSIIPPLRKLAPAGITVYYELQVRR